MKNKLKVFVSLFAFLSTIIFCASFGNKVLASALDDEPVDVIIKYIDLTDKHLKREGVPQIKKDYDNEELRYALRSIDKNMPWVRKTFIVMPNEKVRFLKDKDRKGVYISMDFDKLIYFIPFTLLVLAGLNLVIGGFRNYNSSGVINGSYALSFYLCIIVGFIFMIVPIAIQFFNFRRQYNETLKKLINLLLGIVLSIVSVTFCFVIGFGTLDLPIPYFIILSIFSLIYFLIALQSYFFSSAKTKKKDFFENNND